MIRRTYIRKVEDRLARLEDDIDRLRNRMAVPVGEIRDRIEREIPICIRRRRRSGKGFAPSRRSIRSGKPYPGSVERD